MLSPIFGPTEIYPALLKDEDGLTLVDTGMLGQFEALKQTVEDSGAQVSDIKRVIITHQDIDHIGNLQELVDRIPGLELLAHADDIPYLNGSLPLVKFSPERIAQMPGGFQDLAHNFLKCLPGLGAFTVLKDGDMLPWGGGVEVIHTPGHTPGHICLYLPNDKLLLAADELCVVEGKLAGPAEWATPDMPLALHSLRKLEGRPIAKVLCYHGGLFEGSPQPLIEELA
ncbi:Glyoxylase, beta-lactamase superfamily II [Paenibacillus sophorae]|uniref:Glyoxylase, beta-lactamase superfamily II n=2 Tax=Paenibacillus sophorae TaxID=1333845 RepID=A0A1H8L1A0_9BACL|nr:MBL fold metallo-hydrolase [Paenibacillus sophorae]QWU18266.1 MBL fold metallo-hydrolase [Paenibacillus sophorae]SEN98915.1 Glyoxylase, beta-lactamase superfamily II [Paenibacillus sophorae]